MICSRADQDNCWHPWNLSVVAVSKQHYPAQPAMTTDNAIGVHVDMNCCTAMSAACTPRVSRQEKSYCNNLRSVVPKWEPCVDMHDTG